MYESLGFHDHHSHPQVTPADDSDPDAILAAIVAIPGPAFTISMPSGLADPGATPMTGQGQHRDGDVLMGTLQRIALPNAARPGEPDFLTAEPPPRRAA